MTHTRCFIKIRNAKLYTWKKRLPGSLCVSRVYVCVHVDFAEGVPVSRDGKQGRVNFASGPIVNDNGVSYFIGGVCKYLPLLFEVIVLGGIRSQESILSGVDLFSRILYSGHTVTAEFKNYLKKSTIQIMRS